MIYNVRPAPGRRVRKPDTLALLDEDGEFVVRSAYWDSRIADLDVLVDGAAVPPVTGGGGTGGSAGALATRAAIKFTLNGGLAAGETVFGEQVDVDCVSPANFGSSDASLQAIGQLIGDAPSAATEIKLFAERAGALMQVGTATIGTDKAFAFATTGGLPVSWAAEDMPAVSSDVAVSATIILKLRAAISA